MTDSEAIQLIAREMCPDPATGKLVGGGVADLTLGRLLDLENKVGDLEAKVTKLVGGLNVTGTLTVKPSA